jgi:putative tryptophan/tyrosine transport system substrate-binding protein
MAPVRQRKGGATMAHTKFLKMILGTVFLVIWTTLTMISPVLGQPPHARVAVLTPGLNWEPIEAGFREGMARLGYKEGQNITFIVDDTKGSAVDLPSRVGKLLAARPDVLFTVMTAHSVAAKEATATVPIVFAFIGDPVGAGLVASFASSKNNVTGVSSYAAPLTGKRLEALLEIAPKIKRVLVIVTPSESFALSSFKFLDEAAKKFKVQLVRRDITKEEDIEQVLQKTSKGSVDAIFYVPSVLQLSKFDLFVKKAKSEKIPLVVHDDSMVKRGALFSYGYKSRQVGFQTAALVDKVLKGAKPTEIMVEIPDKLFLTLNVTTAKEIGLKIPPSVLERAELLE